MEHNLFGDEPFRALTWKDPFGTLMLEDKDETRTWPTNYRGLVLICVAKQSYRLDQLINICGPHQAERVLDKYHKNPNINSYPGKAIAVGRLINSLTMQKEDEDKCYVQHVSGLWRHVYEEVHAIEPIPWKGKQGWANVPTQVRQLIRFL